MRTQNATLFLLVCLAAGNAFAADRAPAQAAPKPAGPAQPAAPGAAAKDEKVDISDLENKYWAPKDTDFSVVQNRTYTKEKRLFFSLGYGIPTSDAYSDGSFLGLTGNYFFTERHGIQLTYMKANLHPSDAIKDLADNLSSGVYPNHGRMNNYLGVSYNFVPFYSKMSFMGKKIIYFDMAFSPSLGSTNYAQQKQHGNSNQDALTYGLDVTQFFFFSNHFAARFDWKNQWYSQKVEWYRNTAGKGLEGDSAGSKTIHDSILMLGAQFFW